MRPWGVLRAGGRVLRLASSGLPRRPQSIRPRAPLPPFRARRTGARAFRYDKIGSAPDGASGQPCIASGQDGAKSEQFLHFLRNRHAASPPRQEAATVERDARPADPALPASAPADADLSVLNRRQFLQHAGTLAGGALLAQALPPLQLLQTLSTVANPLEAYPDRAWERVYRDQYRYDSSFTFVCSPNDTHHCRLRAFVRNGVIVRIEQNY
ncbi:MAG: twin-arginine translocation signal domain-containing protein, partial [Firmicutes bacterium]|nr:twin-arginine translocation signal domain-containing protein [Bacillota bacterium]